MLSIRSSADFAQALSFPLDPQLRHLLGVRQAQLLADRGADLGEYAHLIIVQPGDTVAAVEATLEFPIGMDGIDPDFIVPFEWVARHGDWYEAVLILSDDGFATVLLVPDHAGIDPRLRQVLREHA